MPELKGGKCKDQAESFTLGTGEVDLSGKECLSSLSLPCCRLQAVSPFPSACRWGCQVQECEPRAGLACQGAQLRWYVVLSSRSVWLQPSSQSYHCAHPVSLEPVYIFNTVSAANYSPTILTQCANKAIIQILFCITRMLGLQTFA